MPVDLSTVEGLQIGPDGRAVIGGPLLELESRLDAVFLCWAARWEALELRFPALIAAPDLQRVDYFRSFPQHATFPVTLDPNAENLERFAESDAAPDAALRLTDRAPLRDVLPPAACYSVYPTLAGQTLDESHFITTRATCFRREQHYAPLERQWCFTMREIICIGNEREVDRFLAEASDLVRAFCNRIDLPVDWKPATDPFFQPKESPGYLFQKIHPVKHEIVFGEDLALGSTNRHRHHFADAFAIERDGEPASSGCVAFGLERWLYALIARFGLRAADWPSLEPGDG